MNAIAELSGTSGHASATHPQPAVELEPTGAAAVAPEREGTRGLHIRPLLDGAAAGMRSAWAASRRGLARRRQEHRRRMVDYGRLEEAREEAFRQVYSNGPMR
jgi:hypothetical protein